MTLRAAPLFDGFFDEFLDEHLPSQNQRTQDHKNDRRVARRIPQNGSPHLLENEGAASVFSGGFRRSGCRWF
jgi:hypothetical protein